MCVNVWTDEFFSSGLERSSAHLLPVRRGRGHPGGGANHSHGHGQGEMKVQLLQTGSPHTPALRLDISSLELLLWKFPLRLTWEEDHRSAESWSFSVKTALTLYLWTEADTSVQQHLVDMKGTAARDWSHWSEQNLYFSINILWFHEIRW